MNTKFLMPTLIGLTLSLGTVQAFAVDSWYYDEDRDAVIFSHIGSPATHPDSHSNSGAVQQSGAWYHDESSDNIVYNVNGNRRHSVQTNTSTDAIGFDSYLAYLDQ